MKKTMIQDERIVLLRRKINNEALGILMISLYCSILIQQFVLKSPVEQYAVETICAIGISFYMVARFYLLGLNLFGEGGVQHTKRMIAISSLITGTVVTTINGAVNYSKYAEHYQNGDIVYFVGTLVIFFISAASLAYIVLSGMHYLNQKKQSKILRQMDGDEND